MKFTKKQRREIYRKAPKDIISGQCSYACVAMKNQIRALFMKNYWVTADELRMAMKEFYLFDPNSDTYYSSWWEDGDKESRIFALLLCAEMCKD
jgi:hypothetical protein